MAGTTYDSAREYLDGMARLLAEVDAAAIDAFTD